MQMYRAEAAAQLVFADISHNMFHKYVCDWAPFKMSVQNAMDNKRLSLVQCSFLFGWWARWWEDIITEI